MSRRNHVTAALLAGLMVLGAPIARATDAAWHPLSVDLSPTPNQDAMVAFDAGLNLLYVYDYYTPDRIWMLDPESQLWSSFVPGGSAPPAFSGRMILDAANDRLVLLRCVDPTPQVYTVNLTGPPVWTTFTPEDGPAPRVREAAVYDPLGQRMIVYGGVDGSTTRYDTWALYLDPGGMKWDKLYNFGPPGSREASQAIFDPIGNRLIIQGGVDRSVLGALFGDVRALSLGATPEWSFLAGSEGPARFGAAAAYDPSGRRMLIFGGTSAGGRQADSWAFDLDGHTWTQLDAGAAPGARSDVSGAIDRQGRFLIYGGRFGDGTEKNDLWGLDDSNGAAWNLVHADPLTRIDGRRDIVLAYDPLRHRTIVTGGTDVNGVDDQTWVLGPGDQRFLKLTTTNVGAANPLRSGGAGVWDPVRDRLLVFGGLNGAPSRDVIALDGATSAWSVVSVPLTPQPSTRMFASGAYDAARDRALFFAGYPLVNARNQVWALSLTGSPSWAQLAPDGTAPTQRYGHTFTADPGHDRMILFGGGDGGVVTNDLYVLSLAGAGTWTQLTGPGAPPPARTFHSAIYDPVNDRLLVWGGKGQFGVWLDDTWEYRFDGSGWHQLAPAVTPPGASASAVYDPNLHRMLVFGGETAQGLAHETWWMDLPGQTTGVPDGAPAGVGFALIGATPNPSFAAIKIAFSLPNGSPAKLELIDLAGRRVRAADVGALGAGRHVVDFGSRGAVAPGLYFARLSRGGEVQIARVCVMR